MGSHSKHLGAFYRFASKNRAFYALTRSLPAASHRRCRGPFFLQVVGSQTWELAPKRLATSDFELFEKISLPSFGTSFLFPPSLFHIFLFFFLYLSM
jgi:hypothetical protein